MKEESNVDVIDPVKMGILRFEFNNDPVALEVHIFKATKWLGEPVERHESKVCSFTS